MSVSGKEIFYLIIGMARSGNTVTHLALASHPEISACIDEVRFDPFFNKGISVFTYGSETAAEKQNSHLSLFKMMASLSNKMNSKAFGVHTVVKSRDAELLVKAIQNNYPSLKIILIKRLNMVAQLASVCRSNKNQIWSSFEPVLFNLEPLAIAEAELIHHIKSVMVAMNAFESLKDTHEVSEWIYEDELEIQKPVFKRLFDFLGVQDFDPSPFIPYKLNPPAENFVTNYKQLLITATNTLKLETGHSKLKDQFMTYLESQISSPNRPFSRLSDEIGKRVA